MREVLNETLTKMPFDQNQNNPNEIDFQALMNNFI